MTRGHLLTMIRIYGLRNCDTCRRAIKDLERALVIYEFCDFRRDGLNLAKINEWERLLGYDFLLNRKGATWRGLSEDEKADLTRCGGKADCQHGEECLTHELWAELSDKIYQFLDGAL